MLISLCGLLVLWIRPEHGQPSSGILLGFGFLVAMFCGCQFPLVLQSGGEGQRKVAFAFTADLVGAACGALLTSVLLIPYLGLTGTLLVFSGLKISSFLVSISGQRRSLCKH
jgi:predicted membrane-bound spermidine synthase